jgi:hypothetical protein
MPRPSFTPTERQRSDVAIMAGSGRRHENMAAKLGIAPKTLRKHFRKELSVGAIEAHLGIRKTLYGMATSGRNLRATMQADKAWDRMCARRSGPDGQPMPPPQILIRTNDPETQNAQGGPDR